MPSNLREDLLKQHIDDVYFQRCSGRKDSRYEGVNSPRKRTTALSRSRNQPGQLALFGSLNYRLFV